MNHKKFFSFNRSAAVAICLSLAAASCHNDDVNPPPAESDTASSSTHNASAHNSADMKVIPDSTGKMADASLTPVGMAKPDSTKRGKKGRVTVTDAPKLTGSMEADASGVYSNVEVYPSFPGGASGLQAFFDKNLNYPETASADGVDGTVNIMFTVDEKGKLTDPHIMGDRLGYGLEDEALRAVKAMPAWVPGKLKGKNVKTRFTLPVRFELN